MIQKSSKSLRDVQETYNAKKIEFLNNQSIQKANLKGQNKHTFKPSWASSNNDPTKKEKDNFAQLQKQQRETFEQKWQQRALLASQGKEWRPEKIKEAQKKYIKEKGLEGSEKLAGKVNKARHGFSAVANDQNTKTKFNKEASKVESKEAFKARMKSRQEAKRSKSKDKGKGRG